MSFEQAVRIVQAAKEAGADAIKLQTRSWAGGIRTQAAAAIQPGAKVGQGDAAARVAEVGARDNSLGR